MLVFRGLGTRTKHSGSNTSSCGTTQWSTCHGGNSSSVCTCHGTPAPPAAAAAAAAAALVCSSRDEVGAFCWHEISPPAGSQLPSIKVKITVACRCPTQAFKIISSLGKEDKKLSPAAAFKSGMRRSWELLLPGASAHCGGRHWCDPNRAVCHRPTHGSTNQWLVNHRTQ